MPVKKCECGKLNWEPRVDEDVLVIVDRGFAALSGWASPMRLGKVAAVAIPHVKVTFTNGDTFTGDVSDLKPLRVGT